MRTHSRNFCQPVTNAIPSSFLLREGERKKRLQVFPRKGERKRTTFPRRWCGEIKRRIYIRTCIYIYIHIRARHVNVYDPDFTRLRARRVTSELLGRGGGILDDRQSGEKGNLAARSIVAGTGDPIVKQLYNYRGLVINCQPFQRLPRLQSSSCCALALTPRPRAINSLTFHRQTYLPVKLNGRRIRDYLLNQFPKTAIVEARAPPPLPSHSSPLSRCAHQRVLPKKRKWMEEISRGIFWENFSPFFTFFFLFFFSSSSLFGIYSTTRGGDGHREDLEEVEWSGKGSGKSK